MLYRGLLSGFSYASWFLLGLFVFLSDLLHSSVFPHSPRDRAGHQQVEVIGEVAYACAPEIIRIGVREAFHLPQYALIVNDQ
jgi:hypothetical protein